MRYKFLFIIMVGLLLSSCSTPEATSQPTQPAEPFDTQVAVETATEVVAPTAVSATATIPPPPTAVPTAIPSATPIAVEPVQSINLNLIADGFDSPVFLTHAFDARLFVVEQAGIVRINEAGTTLDQPFLDITDRVGSESNEQGLLSLAFHPDYVQNGRFYVNYTDKNGDTNISRFSVTENPNIADPASEAVLLTIEQPFGNHNGGQIAFGPDGYLYIGMGDGGSQNDPQNNAQNPDTLLGTLLRIDVNVTDELYGIPPDNPFADGANGRPEVWAIGLRNPWRFSFDRQTGDLFIADVGQNVWEELNFQPATSNGGENYGWNILEGTHCLTGNNCAMPEAVPPFFEYSHVEGCSVTGGYLHRGHQYLQLNGNYFFSDFCSGTIWGSVLQADGIWKTAVLSDTDLNTTSFGEDFHGEIYILSRSGEIYQIAP